MPTTNGQSASVIETALQRTIHDHTPTDPPPDVEVISPPVDVVIDLEQESDDE